MTLKVANKNRQKLEDAQFTDVELTALKALLERYFDIKEYGINVWGRRFYERLYAIAAKIEDSIAAPTGTDLHKDELTYIDLRILLNIVQSEGLRWAKREAPNYWYLTARNVTGMSEDAKELVIGIIMLKLKARVGRYEL